VHAASHPSLPLRALSAAASSLSFRAPTRVDVVGSFLLRTMAAQPTLTVDLAVEMPAACFSSRDVKNYVYADKRSLFLGVLADALLETAGGDPAAVCVAAFQGDPTKPVLLVNPSLGAAAAAAVAAQKTSPAGHKGGRERSGSIGSVGSAASAGSATSAAPIPPTLRIRVIPTLPRGVFSPTQLRPAWNNVRPWVLTGQGRPSESSDGAGAGAEAAASGGSLAGGPTPHYNAAIAEDAAYVDGMRALHAAFSAVPALPSALAVAKAWLRRRGWHRCSDHLTPVALTAIAASLVQGGKILPAMNTLQCIRVLFQFLAKTDLTATPIVVRPVAGPAQAQADRKGSGAKAAAMADDDAEGGEDDDDDDDDGADFDEDEDEDEEFDEGSDEDEEDDDDDDEDEVEDDEFTSAAAASTSGPQSSPPPPPLSTAVDPATIAQYRRHFPVVILGPCGVANYAARMSAAAAAEVRRDAKLAALAVGTGGAAAAATGTGSAGSRAEASVGKALPSDAADAAALFERLLGDVAYPALQYDRVLVAPMPACPLTHLPPLSTSSSASAAAGGKAGKAGKGAASTPQSAAPPAPALPQRLERALCSYTSWPAAVSAAAAGTLRQALTDRIAVVRVQPAYPAPAPDTVVVGPGSAAVQSSAAAAAEARYPCPEPLTWGLSSSPPVPTCLWVCVQLSPEAGGSIAGRTVDKGPAAADAAKSKAYLDLWGAASTTPPGGRPGLAELRRFADGSTLQSVVWGADRLGGRAHARAAVVPLIVCATLARHCGIAMPINVLHAGDAVAVLYPTPRGDEGEGAAAVAAAAAGQDSTAALVARAKSAAGDALVLADAARACPSLSLERVLDLGGHAGQVTRVTVTPSTSPQTGAAASAASVLPAPAVYSPLTGFPSAPDAGVAVSAVPLLPATSIDSLGRGPVTAFVSALSAVDWLSTALRTLKGLPLGVSAVVPTAPELRYTGTAPPGHHPLASGVGGPRAAPARAADVDPLSALLGGIGPSGGAGAGGKAEPLDAKALLASAVVACSAASSLPASAGGAAEGGESQGPTCGQTLAPLELVLTLEASSKWPDEPAAISTLKTAFLLKIQYGLTAQHRGLVAATAHEDYVDILVGGYAFRAYLHVDREVAVLQGIARRAPLAKAHGAAGPARGAGGAGAGAGMEDDGNEKDDADEELDDDGEDDDDDDDPSAHGGSGSHSRRVRGSLNVAPVGAARAEAPTSKSQRKAASKASGFDVTQQISRAELAGRIREVFGGASGGLSATAAGLRLDALHLRGVARPRHARTIHGFATRFSAYGPAVRIAALWLRRHMLGPESPSPTTSAGAALASPDSLLLAQVEETLQGRGAHFPHEAVELLMGHVFVSPHPYPVPVSPAVAFLRFLRLLGRHDWAREPLLVDLEEEEDPGKDVAPGAAPTAAAVAAATAALSAAQQRSSDRRTLGSRFREARGGDGATGVAAKGKGAGGGGGTRGGDSDVVVAAYPPTRPSPAGPALYVVTPQERGAWRPIWTRQSPTWEVLGRAVRLAREAEAALAAALSPSIPAAAVTAAAGPGPSVLPKGARPLPAAFFGRPTHLRQLWTAAPAPHPTEPASPSEPPPLLLAAFQTDTAPFHAVVETKALSLLPRSDGRHYGPLKPPVDCAAALAASPYALAEPVAEAWGKALAEAIERRRGGPAAAAKHGGPGGADAASSSRARLVLAVPDAEVDDAAHGVRAAGAGPGGSGGPGGAAAPAIPRLTVVLPSPVRMSPSKLQLSLYQNLLPASRGALLVGFDPLSTYLRVLRSAFGRYALFFPAADGDGASAGNVLVGVVWRPGAFQVEVPRAAAGGSSKKEGGGGGGKKGAADLDFDAEAVTTATGAKGGAAADVSAALLARALPLLGGMTEAGQGLVKGLRVQM
jgi:hypothetical protein